MVVFNYSKPGLDFGIIRIKSLLQFGKRFISGKNPELGCKYKIKVIELNGAEVEECILIATGSLKTCNVGLQHVMEQYYFKFDGSRLIFDKSLPYY